jgi:hypothetical protein
MTYTSIGGVYVSIFTGQWQARLSVFICIITLIYVSVTFRPSHLPALPPYLDVNERGLGSLATLGISFPATAMFNDVYWQRVWSSENDHALLLGSFLGGIYGSSHSSLGFSVMIVVFWFGLGGFLASWAQLPIADSSTAFFSLLANSPHSWILVLVTVLFKMAHFSFWP